MKNQEQIKSKLIEGLQKKSLNFSPTAFKLTQKKSFFNKKVELNSVD